TDLREVVWEKDGAKIRFRRSDAAPLSVTALPAAEASSEPESPGTPLYIRSTMVGTFFRSDSADRPPMVVEGTEVDSGQAVGSVEAMKIRKDVVAAVPCRIVRS